MNKKIIDGIFIGIIQDFASHIFDTICLHVNDDLAKKATLYGLAYEMDKFFQKNNIDQNVPIITKWNEIFRE